MPNLPQGTVSNVLVGPARILLAPIGTALPVLDGTVDPTTFVAAWKEVGYTDAGVQLAYAPTNKDINVDEETAPVKKILDTEKATISTVLSEATLQNLQNAISASILTLSAADVTHAQLATLEVGSGALVETLIALEGLSPQQKQRIFIGYRAVAESSVQTSFQRNSKTMFPVQWGLMSDPTRTVGKRLFKIVDFIAPHS